MILDAGEFGRPDGGSAPESMRRRLHTRRPADSGRLLACKRSHLDMENQPVQVLTPPGILTRLMIGRAGSSPDQLRHTTDIAFSPTGLLVVVDRGNHRIQIWDVGVGRGSR